MCRKVVRARLELLREEGPIVGVVDEFGRLLAVEYYCNSSFKRPEEVDVIDKCGSGVGVKFYLGGEVPRVRKLAMPNYLVDRVRGVNFDRVYIYVLEDLYVRHAGVKGFIRYRLEDQTKVELNAEECVLIKC